MTINELSCDRPEVIFRFPHHHGLSLLEDGLENLIHLTFLEEFLVLRPRSGRSRVKVDALRRCPLPKILTVPSATGNMKFPLLCGVNTSFALSLLAQSSDASISSNSSMSATIMCPFQIPPSRVQCITEEKTWQDFCSKLMQSRLVFRRNKVIFDHCSKRKKLVR